MKAPEKKGKTPLQKTILLNKFGKPLKPYKPNTPYSARNSYSNRRSFEEIQRQNQILKDNGQWNEQFASIAKWIGVIIFIIIVVLSIMINGIKDGV